MLFMINTFLAYLAVGTRSLPKLLDRILVLNIKSHLNLLRVSNFFVFYQHRLDIAFYKLPAG